MMDELEDDGFRGDSLAAPRAASKAAYRDAGERDRKSDDDNRSSDAGEIGNHSKLDRVASVNLTQASPVGIVKQGILSKRARAKFIRPWALRKIVLDEQYRLFYYDRDTLKGVINLIGTGVRRVSAEEADGRCFAFEVVNINDTKTANHKANNLLLTAGSLQEADEWIEAINSLTRQANRSNQNTEYQSFQDVAKQSTLVQPVDLKKLKQQRRKHSENADMGDEDDYFTAGASDT